MANLNTPTSIDILTKENEKNILLNRYNSLYKEYLNALNNAKTKNISIKNDPTINNLNIKLQEINDKIVRMSNDIVSNLEIIRKNNITTSSQLNSNENDIVEIIHNLILEQKILTSQYDELVNTDGSNIDNVKILNGANTLYTIYASITFILFCILLYIIYNTNKSEGT
jgi:hypothetical protein